MNTQPLVSIIVPVYNVEKYLRKCLDSLLNQSYDKLEIICVNDGSTDSSAAILEEYAARDSRIKIIAQPNAGLAAARNTGLRHTAGEWVTGVDSDDYLAPDAIEYALQGAVENCDIIFTGITMEWVGCAPEEGCDYDPSSTLHGVYPVNDELLKSTPHEFCGKLWRVSFLREHNCQFPEGLWYEDWYFYWAYVPQARAISFLPVPKYYYLRRPDSIMGQTTQKPAKAFDYMLIMDKLLAHRSQHPLPAAWSNITLFNFTHSRGCALVRVPDALIPKVHLFCAQMIKQYQLAQQFEILSSIIPVPWYLKPFISRRFGKITYKLLGLPIITVTLRESSKVIRCLGIKICK